jgi:hypothetical protein
MAHESARIIASTRTTATNIRGQKFIFCRSMRRAIFRIRSTPICGHGCGSNLQFPERFRGKSPLTLLTSNPGGPGHSWLKRMFVDGGEDGRIRRMPEEEGGSLRQYIKGLWSDNPDLTKNDPGYLSRLRALPDPHQRAALLHGDWSVAEGSVCHRLEPGTACVPEFCDTVLL